MAERARLLTPAPLNSLRTIPQLMAGTGKFSVWRDLAAGRPRTVDVDKLTTWQRAHLDDLADWESRWETAVAGTSLLHFDPRADNYLIDANGCAWVLDWRRACRGAAWVDLTTLLPNLTADGHDPEQLFADHPAAAHAESEDVNAYLATLAGYWADTVHLPNQPEPLRDLRERSGRGATEWLRRRTTR